MNKRIYLLIAFIALLGLFMVACGGNTSEPVAGNAAAEVNEADNTANVEEPAAEEPAAEEPAAEEPAAEEPAAEEPAAEEPAAGDVTPEQLDEAFAAFLADMAGYNTIGLDDLNTMIVEGAPFLLDVRELSELEENGWIEGAVVIPLRELADNLDKLPATDQTIVSYCGSGWRCTIALTVLEAMGYENVLGLTGGSYGGWVEAGYPTATGDLPLPEALDAAELDPALAAHLGAVLATVPDGFGAITSEALNTAIVENPDLILVDVRRPEEVEENGYIDAPNVQFIPLEEFVALRGEWPADPAAPIAVYCGSGHRSTIAMTILWAYGYTDVVSLRGGYGSWLDAGYPTVGAPEESAEAGGMADLDAAFAAFLAGMERYNSLSLEDFNLLLTEDPPPFVLDVRQPEELEENGHIEGAVNIPLREVADHIELLPSFDTPIVSYCGSGWRCTIATAALEALGWENVLSLTGGSFGGWVEAGYPVVEGPAQEALVLDVAEPDPALIAEIQKMLQNVPDGYGVITADDLNIALVENPDLIVIDVRTDAELEDGIIEAANWLHIPLEDFIAEKDQWPADLDAPIVIYCGSGHRSTLAMTILWTYGYTDVHSLRGGFSGWVEAGYPVAEFVAP